MIPEKNRQEWIDAIFEEELREKPRDENFKPKLANGGYIRSKDGAVAKIANGEIVFVTYDEYRPFTLSSAFDGLNLSIEETALSMKSLGESIEKLGKWNDGA